MIKPLISITILLIPIPLIVGGFVSGKPKQAMFKSKAEAEAAAEQFGCQGSHKMGGMWMVCDEHIDTRQKHTN